MIAEHNKLDGQTTIKKHRPFVLFILKKNDNFSKSEQIFDVIV